MKYRGYLIDAEGNKYMQEVNILKAVLTEDTTLTATADYQNVTIPLVEDLKLGSKLTFSNNKIVVGSDIKYVKISAACIIQNSSQANLCGLVVKKNDVDYIDTFRTLSTTSYNDFQIASSVCEVEENDEFSISIYFNAKSNKTTVRKYARSTFLQVEVID